MCEKTRKNYDFNYKNEIMYKLEKKEYTISGIAKKYDIPYSTISNWWREFTQNGEFTDPGNRNDAIPSWSGFNFQGKVMILCVLESINNNLVSNICDLEKKCVELEKLQDFVFKDSNTPISLWQVKATLSKTSLNSYNDALEKIILDKQKCGNIYAKCFLISAAEIEDWDNDNIYSSEVELYRYKDLDDGKEKNVRICDVDVFIKKELKITLGYLSIDKEYIEQIYLCLCNFIDDKVAKFHDIGRNSTYEIYFSEFIDHISKNGKVLIDLQELKEKENHYKRMSNFIHKNINEFCIEECNKELKDCSEECAVNKNYQYLQNVDLVKYVQVILPDIHGEEIFSFGWSDEEIYKDSICDVFKNSAHGATFNDDGKIFIKLNKGEMEVIPTLMEFRNSGRKQEKRISDKLKKIETNKVIMNKIGDGVLSAYTDQAVFQTEGDKFTTINLSEVFDKDGNINNKKAHYSDNIMNKKAGFKKFTSFNNNIIIVDCEKVKEYLKESNRNE